MGLSTYKKNKKHNISLLNLKVNELKAGSGISSISDVMVIPL
jgi:hypothetical protein